ncbi:MAG: hypothetical protein WC824_08855, partial [Bacteroidota bacterium]
MKLQSEQCQYVDAGFKFLRENPVEPDTISGSISIVLIVLCLLSPNAFVAQAQDSWVSVGASPDTQAQLVAAVDSNTCFLLYDIDTHRIPGHPVYISRNGGISWDTVADSIVAMDCHDFRLLTRLDAIREGNAGWLHLLQSVDTGRTWTVMRTLPISTLVERDSIQLLAVLSSDRDQACIFVRSAVVSRMYKIDLNGGIPEVYQPPVYSNRFVRVGNTFIAWGRENAWGPEKIVVSTDFGFSWETVLENSGIFDVRPGKDGTIWAAMRISQYDADIQLVRSHDRRKSWR